MISTVSASEHRIEGPLIPEEGYAVAEELPKPRNYSQDSAAKPLISQGGGYA